MSFEFLVLKFEWTAQLKTQNLELIRLPFLSPSVHLMVDSPNPVDLPSVSAEGSGRSAGKPISFSIANSTGRVSSGQPPRVAPFPVNQQAAQMPMLPRRKRPSFSRHRHDANPALALKVLQDIHIAVDAWHGELKQTVQHIQELYMEGPIVDGWLEVVDKTSGAGTDISAAMLRHADPQELSGYVEHLYQSMGHDQDEGAKATQQQTPSYRLCSLDSDGRLNCIPCPPEQLSTISLAIARHQRLRQLLDQKQYLEARLKRTVEVLTHSRDALDITPTCSSEPEDAE
jgi:hypothetical protein